MTRFLIIIALIIAAILFVGGIVLIFAQGSASFGFTRQGGSEITENRDVANFNKIHLQGVGNLQISQGDHEELTVTTDDRIMDLIETKVEGDTLELSYKNNWLNWLKLVWVGRNVNFDVKVKNLNEIKISGSGEVNGQDINSPKLVINISGSGKVKMSVNILELESVISGSGNFDMSGYAEKQTITINGSGKYLARELTTKESTITINGSGNAELNAQEKLNVTISGSGKVNYLGSPQVDQKISGSGEINQID